MAGAELFGDEEKKEVMDVMETGILMRYGFDKERKGLAARKMYRTIAPWVTENPVLMHVRSANPDAVKLAVDQCAEVGFEMVIMTFGSGFNMESGDTSYYRKIKELADYAHKKGIALGGYSLLASRSVGAKDDIINPATGKPVGNDSAFFGEINDELADKGFIGLSPAQHR